MNIIKVILTAVIGVLVYATISVTPVRAELRAGAAKAVITPDNPVYLGGYYYINTRSKGVHDDIYTRVLTLNNDGESIVLIEVELVIVGGYFAREIRQMVNKEFGIPQENVLVNAIHTHTGPEGYYEEFGKYPKEYDPEMKKTMQKRILNAVRAAIANQQPATAVVKEVELKGFFSNRHNPDGPVDYRGIILLVRDADGKPLTGYLNMPAHATSAPAEQLLISSGWPGFFAEAMQNKIGPDATFLFLQGAAGNISPRGTGGGETPWDGIKIYGDKLADTVWNYIQDMPAGASQFPLAARMETLIVKVRKGSSVRKFAKAIPERIRQIKESDLTKDEKDRRINWLTERMGIENFMQPMIKTMSRVHKGRTRTYAQAMQLGDTLLVAFPGEPLSQVSIEMRRRLAPRVVSVLGYSNDHLGYLTTQEVYEEGGYEAGMGICYPETTYELMDVTEKMARELIAE